MGGYSCLGGACCVVAVAMGGGVFAGGLAVERVPWEAPRPCPLCRRIYSNNSNLRRHVKTVHSEKRRERLRPGRSRYKYSLMFQQPPPPPQ